MRRRFVVLAMAALLAGVAASGAAAAGRDGFATGVEPGAGAFRGGDPFMGSVPATPPILNPSTSYTVPQAPEQPVSPGSPGSVFGND
jgi:hypothetical protein